MYFLNDVMFTSSRGTEHMLTGKLYREEQQWSAHGLGYIYDNRTLTASFPAALTADHVGFTVCVLSVCRKWAKTVIMLD